MSAVTERVNFREAMKLNPEAYPERAVGDWRIVHRTIEDDSLDRLRAALHGHGRYTPAGSYVGLFRGGTIVMSDVPDEMTDHLPACWAAERAGGRVLINGLGLGMVLHAVLAVPAVEHVDVVEASADVIALTGPVFADAVAAGRVTIHHADAFEQMRAWPAGSWWSVAWHDIWDVISEDNLPEMAQLNRSYGRRVGWQGAWCQEVGGFVTAGKSPTRHAMILEEGNVGLPRTKETG